MRRTKTEALKTYRKILSTALILFKNNGYHGTSISDIAKSANVTRGAVYWHFKNKPDIFIAIGDMHLNDMREKLYAAAESDSPLRTFADIIANFFTILEQDSEKYNFCALMHRYSYDKSETLTDITIQEHYFNLWYEIASKIIRSAKAKGEISAQIDENFANLYIRSSIAGISHCYFSKHEQVNVSKYSKQIMDSVINSLRCDHSSTS